MSYVNQYIEQQENPQSIHGGHFGAVLLTAVFLVGISLVKNPQLFAVFKPSPDSSQTAASDVPHYYAYVTPAEDQPQPMVAGASTNQGPSIIQDDGTVVPVDMGQVLGASTEGVVLSLDDIKVSSVPDSSAAVQKYFNEAQKIESNSIGDANFGAALTSGDQAQINQQAQKIIVVRDALQKLSVPESLVKLQKLKIIQYNSSISLLQNFTQADKNPDLVNENMQQFLKSQQDLDAENTAMAQKYPTEDPYASLYSNSVGVVAGNNSSAGLNSLDNSNANQ